MNDCIVIIPARKESKRIRNKNIKPFLGKPIISHTLNKIFKSKIFSKVYVSTDSIKIKKIVEKKGAIVPYLRPKKLSNDSATIKSVVTHMIKHLTKMNINFKYVCCIYSTSIFIDEKKLKKGFELMKKNPNNYVISVNEVNTPIQRTFKLKNNKIDKFFSKKFLKKMTNKLENYYFDAGQFYFADKKLWLSNKISLEKNSQVIKMGKYNSVDINDIQDWDFAKILYKNLF